MRTIAWRLFNSIQALFTAFWTLTWVSVALVVLALTFQRWIALTMARRIWAAGLLWGARARLEIEGLENVDFSKPHVYVSNHDSMIDIPVVFRALPTNLHFIIKKELKVVPFVGWFAWATGMIFVDRADQIAAAFSLRRLGRLIRGGRSVIAFPEGTRSRGRGVLPFKRGVFVAAIESGVPVVPIALLGTEQVLPSDAFAVRPGVITVRVGRPIPTEKLGHRDRDRLTAEARDAVIALVSRPLGK